MPYDYIEEYQKQDNETIWEFRDKDAQSKIDISLTETDYANPLSLETMQAQVAKNTKIKLDPIQDLHGFDKPWTGGAGKNLCPINKLNINISDSFTLNAGSYTFSFYTTGSSKYTTSSIIIYDSNNQNILNVTYGATGQYRNGQFTLAQTKTLYIRQSNVIADSDGYFYSEGQIEVGSQATSYEPYSNICPILGHDQIDILGCGANIWDEEWEVGGIGQDGNNDTASNRIRSKNYILCVPNTTYYFKQGNQPSTNWSYFAFYDENKNFISPRQTVYGMVTVPANAKYLRFNTNNTYGETYNNDISINYPSTDTSYHAYQESNNLSIDLPSTVYGGVLDLESGEVNVTDGYVSNLGDLTWETTTVGGNPAYKSNALPNVLKSGTGARLTTCLCSHYEVSSTGDDKTCFIFDQDGSFYIRDTSYSSAADLKTSLNGGTLTYKVIPFTLYISPEHLKLLKAQNNLTTSQYTQIKVTYRNGVFATLEPVSENNDGLMSRLDKLKLDNIVPATTTTDGLMSATDKTKLDGIATSATKTESSTTNGNIKIDGTETQVYDDSEIKGELSTDTTTIEGNPLNFTTLSAQNAKSTILSLEPIQDLHGYDKPWTGGAGKNLAYDITYISATSKYSTVLKASYKLKQGKQYVISFYTPNSGLQIYRHTPSLIGFESLSEYSFTCDGTRKSMYGIATTNAEIVDETILFRLSDTSTTGVGYITDFQIEEVASGVTIPTSYEPYENICPISGRSEIGILGCGKNLANQDGTDTSNGYKHNYYISSYGTETSASSNWDILEYIRVKPSTTYKISGTTVTGANGYAEYDINKSMVAHGVISSNPFTLVTSANTKYIRINRKYDTDLTVQVEESTQTTTYEPYTKSNNITINLGQTVYGGTLDVENGVLVAEKVNTDLSTLDFSLSSPDLNVWRSSSLEGIIKPPDTNTDLPFAICDSYYPMGYNPITRNNNGAFAIADKTNTNAGRLVIIDYRFTSVSDFINGVSGQTICYELATPTEISLTPNTINLLKGVNNISVDDENATISLTYRDGKVATLADLTSAMDNLDSKIDDSKILTDTVTGDKYILVVTNGVLSVEQISN